MKSFLVGSCHIIILSLQIHPKCWGGLNRLTESASALGVFWNLLLSLRHSGLRCVMCDLRGSLHSHTLDRPTPKEGGVGGVVCVFNCNTPQMAQRAVSEFPVRPSALHQAANALKKWASKLNINPCSISVLSSLLSSCQSKSNVTHIH